MKNFYSKKSYYDTILANTIFLLCAIFALSNNCTFAQCKLDKVKDDFSGSQTIKSKDVVIASVFPIIGNKKPWEIDMNFEMQDNLLSFILTHESQSYSTTFKSIYFKFTDGSILKFDSPSGSGDYNTGLGYEFTYTYFDISKEDLIKFTQSDLLKIQASFTNFPDYPIVEQDLKMKSAEKIRKDASCMLSEFILVEKTQIKPNDNDIDAIDVCKYEKNLIDDFTKKRNVLTQPSTIFESKIQRSNAFSYFRICGCILNGENALKFSRGVDPLVGDEALSVALQMGEFDQVDLLLENDEVVSFKNTDPIEFIANISVFTMFKIFTINDDKIWVKLRTVPLKKIKLSLKNKEILTQEIYQKNTKSIMKSINCIDALNLPK